MQNEIEAGAATSSKRSWSSNYIYYIDTGGWSSTDEEAGAATSSTTLTREAGEAQIKLKAKHMGRQLKNKKLKKPDV